jgi:DNA-binding NtrC family response regulator
MRSGMHSSAPGIRLKTMKSSEETIPLTPENATEALLFNRTHARLRKLSLFVAKGPDAGRRVFVTKRRFVVGKGETADLRLIDATVSRNHFELEQRDDDYIIRDLDSTNGTSVNGMRIREAILTPGVRIVAGKAELLFQPVYETPELEDEGAEAFGSLVAASPSMRSILALLRKAARTNTTVLLRGETGVGKSALAKALHKESNRKEAPFVVFDCASAAPTLIESELFGVKKGAFTGAYESRPGACEAAQNGILFIDEIGDLPMDLQAKLLRVLEEREVRRLGDSKPVKLDFQIITATKVDLEEAVKERRFRRDLYYRIAVLEVVVPPLRERREDIPLLGDHFFKEMTDEPGWSHLTPALRSELLAYHWPGNIRELRNVLERLQCIGPEGGLPKGLAESGEDESHLPFSFDLDRPFKEAKEELIDAFEQQYLMRLLERSDGRIAPAAREAGLNRKYFYDLLRKHKLHGRE